MRTKINWGVLSTAKIGLNKVIPAMQKCENCEIIAISSRDAKKAEQCAKDLGIKKWYDSYEAILADEDIDAVYIPLPNNMHVPWAIKALKAGKHVLCEKPIGISAEEAMLLEDAAKEFPHFKIMEAFMYHFHPQWSKVKSLIAEGKIGEVKSVQAIFSYYNVDPQNIRNRPEVVGGALMDIGCYCVSFPRFIFDAEPKRVISIMDFDPVMKTDRLTAGLLDFSEGRTASFMCSTQLMPYQRVHILGTDGHIEVEIPVNAPNDNETFVKLRTKTSSEEFVFKPIDQYTLQGEYFSNAILSNSEIKYDLNDAIANMKVIDSVIKSSKENSWISIN